MSAYEGSKMQEADEDRRRATGTAGHTVDTCRCGAVLRQCRCIGPHTPRVVQDTCPKCKPIVMSDGREPWARPATPSVGSRRTIVELTAADIRKLIGAPASAVVDVTPEIDHGPNCKTEARIVVSWREGA